MKQPAFEPLDLLRKLGDEYRHVEQEHRREPPSRDATRHRLAEQMRTLEAHFERMLAGWTIDEALRARWREFLHGREPVPDEPRVAPPPLFKGRTDAGALVEIRTAPDGYDIFVDGARSDHSSVPWHLDPDTRGPVWIGEHACEEAFDAPPSAIAALTEFLADRAGPPWPWARELFEDGLIDPDLALTPRGRRRLYRERPAAQPAPQARARNFCVLVADAARARVLALDVDRTGVGPGTSELVELARHDRDRAILDVGSPRVRRTVQSRPPRSATSGPPTAATGTASSGHARSDDRSTSAFAGHYLFDEEFLSDRNDPNNR